jgi:catechol 2,3-dioxygenase-like lactoylglutathione lyase family enzyme
MNILFFAGFAPLVRDLDASVAFYRDTLGIDLGAGDYLATHSLEGIKHFGLWTLADAARSCFDATSWPEDVPIPQGNIEFDVDDVAAAAAELQAKGCRLLIGPRTEPWGQVVARLLSPEGLLVGLTFTPSLRPETAS